MAMSSMILLPADVAANQHGHVSPVGSKSPNPSSGRASSPLGRNDAPPVTSSFAVENDRRKPEPSALRDTSSAASSFHQGPISEAVKPHPAHLFDSMSARGPNGDWPAPERANPPRCARVLLSQNAVCSVDEDMLNDLVAKIRLQQETRFLWDRRLRSCPSNSVTHTFRYLRSVS
jgi:hypothetical protein